MLSAALKEHQQTQAASRKATERLRTEAVAASRVLGDAMVSTLNSDVAQVFSTQRELEDEVKHLRSSLGRFTKTSNQWIQMVNAFNQALKEIGDVENWAERLEADMHVVVNALQYAVEETHTTTLDGDPSVTSATQQQQQQQQQQQSVEPTAATATAAAALASS